MTFRGSSITPRPVLKFSLRATEAPRRALLLIIALSLSISGCRRVVLDERFYNTTLDGWTVIDDADTIEGPSVWRVQGDHWLHQSSNIWGRRGDFIGRWYGTYLVAGDSTWTDYTLTVRARPVDNDGFGVVFRFRDPDHFYRLLLIEDGMSGGPLARLDKRNGPDYTEIWSTKRGYRVGVETSIAVSVNADNIHVEVDGARILDARDGSYRSGKIGLFCFAEAGIGFAGVRVVLN